MTTAKTSKARMTRRISAVCRLGLSSGRVTRVKRCQREAPKTSAASPYSCGISPMPATRITIMIAVARQISASAMATKMTSGFW